MTTDNTPTPTPTASAFIVMDESDCPDTGIEGMIGVVCPVSNCTAIRHDWYREITALEGLPDRAYGLPAPAIHASKML